MAGVPRVALTRNGAWLVLPPLVISFGLWSALPPAFAAENFGHGVPAWLSLSENALRIVVFAVPGALLFGASSKRQRVGWWCYGAGLGLYLASYALLAAWPRGSWATRALGFTAPAWTPAFWLLGIAMVCTDSWATQRWRWWMFLLPVAAFLGLHLGHTWLVWSRGSVPS